MAVVVEIGGAKVTASGAEEVGGSADEETGGGAEEIGGGAEVGDSEPDIIDTRLIGLRILPGISRSTYG
jgi:hypothetical protein